MELLSCHTFPLEEGPLLSWWKASSCPELWPSQMLQFFKIFEFSLTNSISLSSFPCFLLLRIQEICCFKRHTLNAQRLFMNKRRIRICNNHRRRMLPRKAASWAHINRTSRKPTLRLTLAITEYVMLPEKPGSLYSRSMELSLLSITECSAPTIVLRRSVFWLSMKKDCRSWVSPTAPLLFFRTFLTRAHNRENSRDSHLSFFWLSASTSDSSRLEQSSN